jgi:hypothetical protein
MWTSLECHWTMTVAMLAMMAMMAMMAAIKLW